MTDKSTNNHALDIYSTKTEREETYLMQNVSEQRVGEENTRCFVTVWKKTKQKKPNNGGPLFLVAHHCFLSVHRGPSIENQLGPRGPIASRGDILGVGKEQENDSCEVTVALLR